MFHVRLVMQVGLCYAGSLKGLDVVLQGASTVMNLTNNEVIVSNAINLYVYGYLMLALFWPWTVVK